MSLLSSLRRALELDAPDWLQERWKKSLYWLMWLAMAALAAVLLLAELNGA